MDQSYLHFSITFKWISNCSRTSQPFCQYFSFNLCFFQAAFIPGSSRQYQHWPGSCGCVSVCRWSFPLGSDRFIDTTQAKRSTMNMTSPPVTCLSTSRTCTMCPLFASSTTLRYLATCQSGQNSRASVKYASHFGLDVTCLYLLITRFVSCGNTRRLSRAPVSQTRPEVFVISGNAPQGVSSVNSVMPTVRH